MNTESPNASKGDPTAFRRLESDGLAVMGRLRRRGILLACLLSFGLAACSSSGDSEGLTIAEQFDRSDGVYLEVTRWPVGKASLQEQSGDYVRTFLAGKTIMTYDGGHGTQVEYTAPSGRVFLWYPGNRQVVRGRVRSVRGGTVPIICYTYQTRAANPVTGQRGDIESCQEGVLISPIRESTQGDPFNLASGQIPFVLSPRRTTLSRLYHRFRTGHDG